MFFPGIFYYKELNCSEPPLIIKANESKQLNPFFVTGFTDAEGCFMISIFKSKTNKIGWVVRAEFQISFPSKELDLLKNLQSFLWCW